MPAQNAEGSAEAATSPSHGSNHPGKGNVVNVARNSRSAGRSAIDSSMVVVDRLFHTKMLSQALAIMTADVLAPCDVDASECLELPRYELDAIKYLVDSVEQSARALSDAYYALPAVLGFFRPAEADPLHDLIREYEGQMAAYNAFGDSTSDDDDALAAATYKPSFDRLIGGNLPPPATMDGAIAALRLLVHEFQQGGGQEMGDSLLPAVLTFFERDGATYADGRS